MIQNSLCTYLSLGREVLLGPDTEVMSSIHEVGSRFGEHVIHRGGAGPQCRHDATRLNREQCHYYTNTEPTLIQENALISPIFQAEMTSVKCYLFNMPTLQLTYSPQGINN